MGCCDKRPYFCAILVCASLALLFHLVGFVTPGWLVTKGSSAHIISMFEPQKIDDGGVIPPEEGVTTMEPWAGETEMIVDRRRRDDEWEKKHHFGPHHHPHHGPHHGPHHRPHHGSHHDDDDFGESSEMMDDGMHDELADMGEWMKSSLKNFDVEDKMMRTSYGLWYSLICIKDKHEDDNEMIATDAVLDDDDKIVDRKRRSEDESSEEMGDSDKQMHKKWAHCKKVSTRCALYHAKMASYYMSAFLGPDKVGIISKEHFAYASLKEHQIESSVALGFIVLGLISAVVGFHKAGACRCAGVASVIFMLLAAFLALVPSARFAHYSVHMNKHSSFFDIAVPYSTMATGSGVVFSLLTALVSVCALVKGSRKQGGTWRQFSNASEDENEKNEKPPLYYFAEPLPEKPGLYDVCDFSDVKPVEELKTPEPEPETKDPNEFVL